MISVIFVIFGIHRKIPVITLIMIFPKNSILSKNASDLKIIGMEPIYIMKFFNRWNFFNGRKF